MERTPERDIRSSRRDGAARSVTSAFNRGNEPEKASDVRVGRITSPLSRRVSFRLSTISNSRRRRDDMPCKRARSWVSSENVAVRSTKVRSTRDVVYGNIR